MDPQSVAFTPRDEFWHYQSEMMKVQQTQADHADRLLRLERRQEEDARMKSVWGSSSPFPGVLSGTPQQGPLHHPPSDAFSGFDGQSTNLMSSLHLDAEDEPRRTGAASRANSVRFDETANQGHWSHAARSSIDLIPRSTSSLSSHPMLERTYSHKSDGRQSSTGHSVHSVASRANSLGIDTFAGLGGASLDAPALTPGLFILGTVPSIIRCWLNTKFKHESLLYAAVCTGSYTSCINKSLVDQLGFSDQIRLQDDTSQKVKLRVYLPEAVVRTASSRSSSPAPQLPTLTVDFTVVSLQHNQQDKSIQVFIGSDILRAHNADILFSSNNITLFDDERSKLSIPMVRPEDESVFRELQVSSCLPQSDRMYNERTEPVSVVKTAHNGLDQSASGAAASQDPMERKNSTASLLSGTGDASGPVVEPRPSSPLSRSSTDSRPVLVLLTSQPTNAPAAETSAARTAGPSPAIWGKWRRDGDKDTQNEWGSATGSNYQRREQGIKVLRPLKSTSRAVSGTQPTSGSPGLAQSRFFEEGKRRVSGDRFDTTTSSAASGPATFATKEGAAKTGSKPAAAGSAFSWLTK